MNSLFTLKPTTGSQVQHTTQAKLNQFFCPFSHKVVILAGPTGVGKTELSLQLARKLGGEIVSSDSMQVYRGMDIGTAKVSFEERQIIPHHLIDIRNIDEPFNVFEYYTEAIQAIESIIARGRVPIVVGGTGFYIHALMYGPPKGPPSDPDLRKRLEEETKRGGLQAVYERLCALDPSYAKTITPQDAQKITRALEIIELSGKRVSDFEWKGRSALPSFTFRLWFLHMPRPLLYRKIDERCVRMLDQGLVEEVSALKDQGILKNSSASNAIGYRQTLEYLESAQSEEDYRFFIERLKTATRHLAKRQITWFKKEPESTWIDISTLSQDKILQWIIDDYYNGPLDAPRTP